MDDTIKIRSVVTPAEFSHSGGCVEVTAIGADWFRIHSTVNRHIAIAVTGEELRAFICAVKAGAFDVLFPERIP